MFQTSLGLRKCLLLLPLLLTINNRRSLPTTGTLGDEPFRNPHYRHSRRPLTRFHGHAPKQTLPPKHARHLPLGQGPLLTNLTLDRLSPVSLGYEGALPLTPASPASPLGPGIPAGAQTTRQQRLPGPALPLLLWLFPDCVGRGLAPAP